MRATTSCGMEPLACATGEQFQMLVDCINAAVSGGAAHATLFDGVGGQRHFFAIDGELVVLDGYITETSDYGQESICSSLAISSDGTCPEVEAVSCEKSRDYQ